MADVVAGSQMRFVLSLQQLFGPLERGEGTELGGSGMKMNCGRFSLGQIEGYLLYRLIKPPQVHPRCAQIYAAEYPATLLEITPALFLTDRLYHLIEPHPGVGNEKVGQKTLGVLPPQCFRLPTNDQYYGYPHIFPTLGFAVTAGGITKDLEWMHFSA